ncbi:sigma-54 dependent transcriptional regulator [bacterium]|nr:sigma-54 dependent transcriptional regulator [bacterium]
MAQSNSISSQGARREGLLLVVDDREDNREALAEALQRAGYTVLVAAGGHEAISRISAHAPDLVLCDLKMPDVDGMEVLKTARAAPNPPEVILLTAFGTVETAVDALKLGAFNYLTKPVNLKDLRAQVERALEHRAMRRDIGRLTRHVEVQAHPEPSGNYIVESHAMRELMSMVGRLAGTQSNVLIEGESGVGKEVVAQALHDSGGALRERPFVAVHCAALPESLLESELFGYEKGAFTGADRQMLGRLELADGGTLFLDEVGEIPLSMQVKLLRVLEQRELTRVGGRQVIKVNFRLLAATNRNLDDEVRAGRFREDLYYRLNVVRLVVPPLRERQEDIIPLMHAFLHRFAAEQGQPPARLTPAIERILLDYAWPGNVRELRNLAERLSIFAAGRELTPADFASEMRGPAVPAGSRTATAEPATLDLQELERRTIEKALQKFGGNRSLAAEALGISRRTLQRKLKEYKADGADEEPDEQD